MFSSKRSRVIAAGIAAVVIGGGSYGIVDATSGSATTAASSTSSGTTTSHASAGGFGGGGFAGGSGAGGSGSNARSGPAAGGSVGTASSVTSSGFTLTTSTGQKVTIKEASSTTYEQGTSPASISAVTSGASVLVLGTTDSSTITASQVIVNPPSSSASSPGGQTIGYSKGTQGSTEKVGTIPSDYSQGSGTLASGTTADKATEAALAVYPGGTIDRVVELSNGDYEVHNIGVNWPHHIFVNADFQVIGADD
jgi:membrane-bound inhibitor of C-type lysozyme